MISRYWRGLFRAERAEDYVRHLREHTFPIEYDERVRHYEEVSAR